MSKKLEHFGHQHAWTLVEPASDQGEVDDEENRQHNLRCFACTEKITKGGAPYYVCEDAEEEDCTFLCLHQRCGDLPLTVNTSYHDQCTADLNFKKCLLRDNNRRCPACQTKCYRFAYTCSECPFLQCFRCALNHDHEAKVSFHQHPVHPINAPMANLPCSVCSLRIRTTCGWVTCYKCNYCDFIVHPHCTDVPLVVESPSHPEHPLKFMLFTTSSICRICLQVIDHTKEWAYACLGCGYVTHIYDYSTTRRYNELEHMSHEHLLLLVEEEAAPTAAFDNSDNRHSTAKECHGCRQSIAWGPYYTCAYCKPYHLHKLCAEVPRQIEHQLHPGCTLDLNKDLQNLSPLDRRCGLCRVQCNGFAYYCSSCNFALDIICSLKAIKYCDKVFHPQHPLVLSHVKPTFKCHACDKDHDGISYQCNTCRFWIHESCSLLATVKEASSHDHEHNLQLIYSIPEEFSDDDVYCQICTSEINHHNWAYYCYRCRYFTHAYDCSNHNRNKVTIDASVEVIDLPLPDVIVVDNEVITGATLKHPHHSMILFEDQLGTIDLTRSLINLVQSSRTWPTYRVDGKDYDGYTFTFYSGKLVVHVTSVDLPHYIEHEAHPHVLQSTFFNTLTRCNACEHSFFGCGYRCTTCAFSIHSYCALLPGKIKHGYDKHPFLLTYSAIEGIEEYICEICEGDIIPKWFYHCEDCDQSIHARCIWKAYIKFEGFYRFYLHKCNLTLVPASNDLPKCTMCRTNETFSHGFAFVCTKHKFMIHLTCIFKDEVEVSLEPFEDEEVSESDDDLSEDEAEVESDNDLFEYEVEESQSDSDLSQEEAEVSSSDEEQAFAEVSSSNE